MPRQHLSLADGRIYTKGYGKTKRIAKRFCHLFKCHKHGIGNPVYPPAKTVLNSHGINPDGKRAVQLTKSDYDKYDLFIGMDSANIRNMKRILDGDPQCKIHKLMEYTDSTADVSDPWYTRDFDRCYNDIHKGCKALLNSLI